MRQTTSQSGASAPRGAHVRVEASSHRYRRTEAAVLNGIDIVMRSGEIAALVGRSGCGQSTLLNLVAGPSQPSRGGVWIIGIISAAPGAIVTS